MTHSVYDFLLQGHRKVIEHYKFLLRSPSLSQQEIEQIESRIAQEEQALADLIEVAVRPRSAA